MRTLHMSNSGDKDKLRFIPHTIICDKNKIFEKYELANVIGKGSFGTVFEAKNIAENSKCAIKIIKKISSHNIESEVNILKSISHTNLIRLDEVFETKKEFYLVTELCEAGDLAKWLKRHRKLSESDARLIMRKIIDAITYLHKNNIVHRDIKLENILIKKQCFDASELDIKISDFGLSIHRIVATTDSMLDDYCGTPLYMAPEVINQQPYSQFCDVWSLGIILYIMLTDCKPFKAERTSKLYEEIRVGKIDTASPEYLKLSEEAKDCLSQMFQVDPAHRITSSELMTHPWIMDKKLIEMPDSYKSARLLMSEMLKEQDNLINSKT